MGNILTVQGRYIVISPSIMLRTSLLSKILSVILLYYFFWGGGGIVRKPNNAGQNFIHIKSEILHRVSVGLTYVLSNITDLLVSQRTQDHKIKIDVRKLPPHSIILFVN